MAGIRNAQMARFQVMSREICEKTANLELSGKRIKECETELEQQRGELRTLKSGRSTVLMEVDRLKKELVEAARNKDEEYQANTKQIRIELARQFRYGWVQGQLLLEHRFVVGPDDYDDELGFDPAGYELFEGMHRWTPPAAFYGPAPSGSIGTIVPSSNVGSSIASTGPVLGFTGFTSSAGFSTCAGPTSEVYLRLSITAFQIWPKSSQGVPLFSNSKSKGLDILSSLHYDLISCSLTPNGIIEICSQDSSADSPTNASDYSAVPDSLRGSRSRSGDARGRGKATMRRSTPRARDEAGSSRVPRCTCHFDHNMLLMEHDLLKEDLACVSAQVTRLWGDLVDADRTMSAAHSDGIRDGFRQGIHHFRTKAKMVYPYVDWDRLPLPSD
ncbi:unnamed protein product [Prunus brigantina]